MGAARKCSALEIWTVGKLKYASPREKCIYGPTLRLPPEFKARVVLEIISGAQSAAEIGREHQSKPQSLSEWKATFLANAANVFEADAPLREAQARIAEMEASGQASGAGARGGKKALHGLTSVQSRNER